MKKEQLYETLGDISEHYISDAHQTAKKLRPVWIHWAATAACLCLLLTVVIAVPRLFKQPSNTEQPANTEQPSNIGQPDTGDSQEPPLYVPSYSSPELDALYKEAPYSVLLPKSVPEAFVFGSSYKMEHDPIANPNGEQHLWLDFHSEEDGSAIEIRVMEYNGKTSVTEPAKPDAYDLSRYYDYLKTPGAVGADAPDVLTALFRAEDFSQAIAEKRMYVFDDGLCKAEIQILCGEYVVAYHYAGTEMSSQSLYEMITSSGYFQGILDGGADITVDADPDNDQNVTDEILSGTLDGGADIAVDALP